MASRYSIIEKNRFQQTIIDFQEKNDFNIPTFIKTLQFEHTILSHDCIITMLVFCCVSMVNSRFAVMSCSEITRFCTQLRPVQNYTFLKDLHPSTSSNFREQDIHVGPQISRILADLRPLVCPSLFQTGQSQGSCLANQHVALCFFPGVVAKNQTLTVERQSTFFRLLLC